MLRPASAAVVFSFAILLTTPWASAQGLSANLEAARQASIVEGDGAAGIRLGDSEDEVRNVLGTPFRADVLQNGRRRDLVYLAESGDDWVLVVRVTFTSADMGVEAIELVTSRRNDVPIPYTGTTGNGYRLGQDRRAVLASYGLPDALFSVSPDVNVTWYRDAGLVVLPGERIVGDRLETRLVVVSPYLSAGEVPPLVGDR